MPASRSGLECAQFNLRASLASSGSPLKTLLLRRATEPEYTLRSPHHVPLEYQTWVLDYILILVASSQE